jgi:GTP-binding protein HflX
MQDYFEEFQNLVKTAKIKAADTVLIKLRQMNSSHFFTKGKMEEVIALCNDVGAERIVISSSLSGMQHRNLESMTGATVIDRTELILQIFKNAAVSAEGKIQVEIAELEIAKTRISGQGFTMGQQQFGANSRGPGETEKEYLYRHYSDLILKARRQLKSLSATRDVQRKKRLKSGMPLVSLVGYTNAGKSSILNALAHSDVLVEDKLFATLDTTTKEVFLGRNNKILLSDTVGFISELPHHLVKAFESTLDELRYASMILHVVDSSNDSWLAQIQVVLKTMSDLEVDSKNMFYVFNKIDKATDENLQKIKEFFSEEIENIVFVSAISAQGIAPLKLLLASQKPVVIEEDPEDNWEDV